VQKNDYKSTEAKECSSKNPYNYFYINSHGRYDIQILIISKLMNVHIEGTRYWLTFLVDCIFNMSLQFP